MGFRNLQEKLEKVFVPLSIEEQKKSYAIFLEKMFLVHEKPKKAQHLTSDWNIKHEITKWFSVFLHGYPYLKTDGADHVTLFSAKDPK